MKRLLDLLISTVALLALAPIIAVSAVGVWAQDRHWPFYTSWRIGRDLRSFRLHKLRSMVVGADKNQIDTTINQDPRITKLGRFLRRYKIDELPQFLNILKGEMSLVGPRPNVEREVRQYSSEEQRMLSVLPGITDLASIVFSDLGNILDGAEDPNLAYNQLVRPWKSRLALFYIDNRTFWMDFRILYLTFVAIFAPERARLGVLHILKENRASEQLIAVVRRDEPLVPSVPPGMDAIVTSRDI